MDVLNKKKLFSFQCGSIERHCIIYSYFPLLFTTLRADIVSNFSGKLLAFLCGTERWNRIVSEKNTLA